MFAPFFLEKFKFTQVLNLCKSEVGLLQRELNRAQFLLNSYRTRRMFMAETNIKMGTGNVRKIPVWRMSSSTQMIEQFKNIVSTV